jgi:hypothetical protein
MSQSTANLKISGAFWFLASVCDPTFWSGTIGGNLFYTDDVIVYS